MTIDNVTNPQSNNSAGAVSAPLTYLVQDSPKPITRMGGPGSETSRCEGEYAPVWVDIRDARQLDTQPSLECEGFELRRQVTSVSDLYDDAQVRSVYYPEMEQLVKEVTGATRVIIFDHNAATKAMRRRDGQTLAGRYTWSIMTSPQTPAPTGSAGYCRATKRRSCSKDVLLSSMCGGPFVGLCSQPRLLCAMRKVLRREI